SKIATYGARGVSPQTRLQEVSRTRRQGLPEEEIAAALLLRAETPRQPSPLRPPHRAQRCPAVVGRAERPLARPEDEAARDARRRPPDRVRQLRRRHP